MQPHEASKTVDIALKRPLPDCLLVVPFISKRVCRETGYNRAIGRMCLVTVYNLNQDKQTTVPHRVRKTSRLFSYAVSSGWVRKP